MLNAEAQEILGGPARAETLTHNPRNGVTRGVWRVSADNGRSAVVKVLSRHKETVAAWASSEDPQHWNYWRREADVYESGLPDAWIPYGIRAPRLLASVDRADGDVALWLEDVRGEPATGWTMDRHGQLAHALGRAHGAENTEAPWLSRRFLRGYIGKEQDQSLLDDDAAWQQPLVRDHFPAGLREAMVRLHAEREWFLQIMESLPRALSHLDLWPANALSGRDNSTVLVDWAFTGDGALGEDIGNYVPDTVFDLFLPAALLPALEREMYGNYRAGLHRSGWRGDARLVRLGMCASAVKYDWLTALMLGRAGEERQLDYGGARTVSPGLRYRERGQALAFLAGWADEARALATELGFPPP
ncbi:aminoglycoside phosphotransferase [Streptomyces beijiangensis]|uniref:Aminoglycoside phosphotransferase n=1 Tax=Streptomyces beijiangensis TaxID=163361 RepID=A0A939FBM6_9ACTN|nr:aminoglycoside phosphotransferase [Streptomyces beijiangensis]MBO0514482.1 aminoglycoside phosphotransferase [Streptomyces beijiangensis]